MLIQSIGFDVWVCACECLSICPVEWNGMEWRVELIRFDSTEKAKPTFVQIKPNRLQGIQTIPTRQFKNRLAKIHPYLRNCVCVCACDIWCGSLRILSEGDCRPRKASEKNEPEEERRGERHHHSHHQEKHYNSRACM